MRNDPIVEEVRKVREELAARFDFNVAAIFRDLRAREAASGARLVSRPKASPPSTPQPPDADR